MYSRDIPKELKVKFEFEKPFEVVKTPILEWNRAALKKERAQGKDRITVYHNCKTGAQGFSLDEVIETNEPYCLLSKQKHGTVFAGVFLDYDNINDMVCFHIASIDCSRACQGETRSWEEKNRFYLDREKNFYVKSSKYEFLSGFGYVMSSKTSVTDGIYMKTTESYNLPLTWKESYPDNDDDYKNFRHVLSNIFPLIFVEAGNKMVGMMRPRDLNTFLGVKDPVGKSGPKQDRLNELIKKPLPAVTIPEKILRPETADIDINIGKFAVIQKVPGEDLCCLRTFNTIEEDKYVKEGGRVYIGKKEIIASRVKNSGGYIAQALLQNSIHWNFSIETFPKEETKGTMLEYFGDIIESIPYEKRGLAIWLFIKFPITEQLYKAGWGSFVEMVMNMITNAKPSDVYKHAFGEYSQKKNMLATLGINKYQFAQLKERVNKITMVSRMGDVIGYGYLKCLKILLAEPTVTTFDEARSSEISISSIDNKTFDRACELLDNLFSIVKVTTDENRYSFSDWYEANQYTSSYYGRSVLTEHESRFGYDFVINYLMSLFMVKKLYTIGTMFKIAPDLLEVSGKMITCDCREIRYYGYYNRQYQGQALNFYNDYLNTVQLLNDTAHYKPYFRDENDIRDMHDTIAAVYNMKKDQISLESFNKRKSVWSKWTWEPEDEEYIVSMPESPEDIANEGITLHHCVKTYIKKVSEGGTNIMFLRKKSDPTEPFFTIEVTNEKSIRQVHGYANSLLSSDPDAEKFLKKWFKEKKLKASSYNGALCAN